MMFYLVYYEELTGVPVRFLGFTDRKDKADVYVDLFAMEHEKCVLEDKDCITHNIRICVEQINRF